MSGKFKFIDFVESLDGDFSNNEVRDLMVNYLQQVAIDAQRALLEKHQNNLVPDQESMRLMQEEANERQRWLETRR